ncbi:MAG: PHP domain-containing protein [Roseburia sp.]|nr:PHP domain-containing protein [Roseburia sp.]
MHIHTFYSDGGQSPADVVAGARRAGLGLIAVTDHDACLACREVKELAKKAGITALDGEEISAYDGDVKVHILGYNLNCDDPSFVAFNKSLSLGAEERTFDILRKLERVNVKISYGDVIRERRCEKSPLHAMYIAVAGARKGYASSPFNFYARYLNYGMPAFSCVCRPTPEETVRAIVGCGGVCSLAHPGRISLEKDGVTALIERLLPEGLSGIEAVYSGHTANETQYYKELADRYGLMVTGGSDTHFDGGNRRIGDPLFYPDGRLLSALKIT